MKKRKKVTNARRLYLKAERLWKEIAFLRDGRECQVKKHFPYIQVKHSEIMQVDHCITRRDKNLFFRPENSTVVCSYCNGYKKNHQKGVDYAIQKIVIEREGGEVFGSMMELHQTHGPNHNWGKVWWLEQVVQDLEHYRGKYENNMQDV